MGDMAVFSFAEHAIEHSRRAEQPDMSAMQRRERSPSHIPLFGKKDSACLAIRRRIEQQILDLIQRNTNMGEDKWSGAGNLVTSLGIVSQWLKMGLGREPLKPSHLFD